MKSIKDPETGFGMHADRPGFERHATTATQNSQPTALTENQKQVALTFKRALADWLQANSRNGNLPLFNGVHQ
jgi:hypothetical protein